MYLGDYRFKFLQSIQHGISNLILTKIGLDNEKNFEEFCKLIFLLKKNFSIKDFFIDFTFIEDVYKFALESIEYCIKYI